MPKAKVLPVHHRWARKAERGIPERIGDYFNIPCPLSILCPPKMGYIARWFYAYSIAKDLRKFGIKTLTTNVWWDHEDRPCVTLLTKRQQYKFACWRIDTTGKYIRTKL